MDKLESNIIHAGRMQGYMCMPDTKATCRQTQYMQSAQAVCHNSPLQIPQQGKNVALAVPERSVYALHERHLQDHNLAFVCMYSVHTSYADSEQQAASI